MASTLYDFGYFRSHEEAERALSLFANKGRPLFLPDYDLLERELGRLGELARNRTLDPRELLLTYQRLAESHRHTAIFCGWLDSNGRPCGGIMRIEVDAAGAYYQCTVNQNHRTSV